MEGKSIQNLLVIAAKRRGLQCCLEDVDDESRLGTVGCTNMEALGDPGKINFTETVSLKVLRRQIGPKEVQILKSFAVNGSSKWLLLSM